MAWGSPLTPPHIHSLMVKLWAFQGPPVSTSHRSQHSACPLATDLQRQGGKEGQRKYRRWERNSTPVRKGLLEIILPVTLFLLSPTKSSSRKFCLYLLVIIRRTVNAPYLNSIKRRQKVLGHSRSKPLLISAFVVHWQTGQEASGPAHR